MAIMRFRILLCVAAIATTLAACQHYAAIGPGNYDIHQKLVVDLDRAWNRQVEGPGRFCPESWTSNGPLLDALCIAPAIADGGNVLADGKEAPKFRSGMNATELVELIQTGLAQSMGAVDFVPVLLEPAYIAGHDGVKFEFKFGTGGGIETDRHALGYAFEADKRLYVILFHAAEIHYFPLIKPAVEKIAASARLPNQRKT
jgi:hypothetical protein